MIKLDLNTIISTEHKTRAELEEEQPIDLPLIERCYFCVKKDRSLEAPNIEFQATQAGVVSESTPTRRCVHLKVLIRTIS